MNRLNPYLRFNTECRAAMEFYRDCLGGELKMMTVGESPMAAQMPPEMKNRIMHALLEKPGMVIMASDMMDRSGLSNGNAISICINGDNQAEIKTYFSKLSEGGKINQPIKEEFFGMYGELTDKFGINWMFQSAPKR